MAWMQVNSNTQNILIPGRPKWSSAHHPNSGMIDSNCSQRRRTILLKSTREPVSGYIQSRITRLENSGLLQLPHYIPWTQASFRYTILNSNFINFSSSVLILEVSLSSPYMKFKSTVVCRNNRFSDQFWFHNETILKFKKILIKLKITWSWLWHEFCSSIFLQMTFHMKYGQTFRIHHLQYSFWCCLYYQQTNKGLLDYF